MSPAQRWPPAQPVAPPVAPPTRRPAEKRHLPPGMLQVKPWDILRMAWGLCRIRVIYFYHEWPSGRCSLAPAGTARRGAKCPVLSRPHDTFRWKGFPRADLAAGCALLLLFFSLLIGPPPRRIPPPRAHRHPPWLHPLVAPTTLHHTLRQTLRPNNSHTPTASNKLAVLRSRREILIARTLKTACQQSIEPEEVFRIMGVADRDLAGGHCL